MSCKHEFIREEWIVEVCKKCDKLRAQTVFEDDLAAANARIAELEADLNESHVDEHGTVWTRPTAEAYCLICKAYDAWKTKAEQAEAQCAAMRLRFEKYVRENCKLIRHSVADGLDKPDEVEGKCGGYCQNFDEPHQICQECIAAYDPDAEYNDEVTDAGTAILTENKRMREALKRARKIAKNFHDYGDTMDIVDLIDEALKGTDNEED